jgi:hypothetical protein
LVELGRVLEAERGPRRLILIRSGPREITKPIPNGLLLRAPTPDGADPRDYLTPEQRAKIGPRDKVIVVRYVDRSLGYAAGE